MSDIKDWSATASSQPLFPEGMMPSQVNDDARQVMAAVKRWYNDEVYADDYLTFADACVAAANKTMVIRSDISLSATQTITASISLRFLGNSKFVNATGGSLRLLGPIVGNPMHQLFSGFAAGNVTFEVGSIKIFHPVWFNYDLVSSISAIPSGCLMDLGNYSSYSIDGTWNVNKAITILGYYATITFPTADNTSRGVKATSSNVAIYGLTVVGGGYADAHYDRVGILAQGTNNATRLTNIILKDCKVSNSVQGIRLEYVDDFIVDNNKVTNAYNCGIGIQTGARGRITDNYVDNVTTGQCYGIIVTHTDTANDTVSTDIMISHNIVKNVPTWHGIDTHGGANLTITDNNVYNTLRGIHIGILQRSSTVFVAPNNIVIEDNTIYNDYNVTKSSAARYIGVQIAGGRGAGSTYTPYSIKGLVCNNNNISGFQYGINMEYITRSIISGNNIKDFYHGIGLGASVNKVLISNNNVDIWDAQAASDCRGISFTTVSIWEAATVYNLNDIVVKTGASNGYSYICTQAGTSGGTEPVWSTPTTTDNSVVWTTITESGVSTGTISNNKIEMSSALEVYAGIKCEAISKTRTITEMNIINNDIICGGNKYHDPLTFLGTIDIIKGYVAVASATSLILGQSGDVIFVTGTTSVTSIAASSSIAGRTVKLIFEGILTFTDGNNLKLAGNFVTTADSTITLSCKGGTWYEDCRSLNS